jgi:UDP-glucose:(heptosyl)LPS alpha-1,3-glucosyltransferase
MTTIVQICPEIGPGSGVGAVAHHLEQEWAARGIRVERFTLEHARGSWLPAPRGGVAGKLTLLARVAWFSFVGTALARRRLRGRADVVSICHNDALAGDIYVNHGIVQAAMRARGGYWWRMLRNPLHLVTTVRDSARYAGAAGHRVVVNLVASEELALREAYPRLRVPTVVIGNGVDVERFAVPTEDDRSRARGALGFTPDDLVLLFVGHEYDRKGLHHAIDALDHLPASTHLLVVGGTEGMVRHTAASLGARGLTTRVHLVGSDPDPRRYFHAADAFVFPTAYESYGLVVLEALACGVPVVATATGCVPDVVVDGDNGFVASADGQEIAEKVLALAARPLSDRQVSARRSAEAHSWSSVADQYLDLMRDRLGASFGGAA